MNKAAIMIRTSSLLLLLLLLTGTETSAQRRRQQKPAPMPARKQAPKPAPRKTTLARTDTTIKSTTLEVYQQYEPELKPMAKPELTPTLPPPPARRMAQEYDVPQQTLYYSYRALPLRPLALGRDTAPAPPQNYLLLGGGNLSTILAEVGISSLRGANWQSALDARYITQEGDIQGQIFREFRLGASGSVQGNGFLLDAAVHAQYRKYGVYGFNHDQYKYPEESLRRHLGSYGLNIGLRNDQPGMLGLDYHPQVSVSLFSATKISSEQSIGIHMPVSRRIDSSLTASVGVHGLFTRLSGSAATGSITNNILQLTPAVSYARGGFNGRLGLYPTFGMDGIAYLLPDISAGYRFAGDAIQVTAGWQARLRQNTMEQLMAANPFILAIDRYQQTRSDDVYGGLSFALGRHLTIWGRGGWNQYSSLPLFIASPGGDGKDFITIYDRQVQAIAWNAGARYAIGEDISLSASGSWYNFYRHSYSRVWGEPGVRLRGAAAWQATRGLRLNIYAEILDQIWGMDAAGQEVKLRGVFDLGASAEYSVIDRLNLFLRTENILDRNNERWPGYPSFGFNIYGGARFRF